MIEFARKAIQEFEEEQDKIYETLIRNGFLTEGDRTNDCDDHVSWKSTVTKSDMFGQNALVSV